MKRDELIGYLTNLAPESSALHGDPVGLLIDGGSDVARVIVALDCTPDVARAAIEDDADLVICHHPLIYRPLAKLIASDPISSTAVALASNGISLYAMHTNWDRASGGINDILAARLGLIEVAPLGDRDELAIMRIGDLQEPQLASNFVQFVANSLGCSLTTSIRQNLVDSDRRVSRVVVCGGAGAEFMQYAIEASADTYVTADVKHHEFIEATGRGLLLVDAGHYSTEAPGMIALAQRLIDTFPELNVVYHP